MIPTDKYSPKRVEQLLFHLETELRQAMRDRKVKEDAWVAFQEAYHAKPVEKIKKFPFHGASNLVIPLIATDVDTMFSRMMGMLFEPQNLFSLQALNPELTPFAPRVQEFLQWAQHNEIDFQGPVGDWILEILKLGTGVLKQRYHREMKKVYEFREMDGGNFEQQAIVLLKDAPHVGHVHLYDYYQPASFKSIQDSPWCAERIQMTWGRYLNRVKAGLYQGSDRISEWSATFKGSQIQRSMEAISGHTTSLGRNLEFFEFWLDYDIDEDGWDEALVCTIHLDTMTYVRLDYNPFFNQEKPYSSARFMRDENSFYGKGLAEMLDCFQEEITAMHNQRIDNSTISNSQTYAVRKDNKDIAVDELIYPGKLWFVNDPQQDIKPLAMGGGTSNAASIENEQASIGYSQRRTGVNDYVYGQPDPSIGYSTAYTTQQMMLNSTRRQGEPLREVRNALSETGTRVLELYQQFNQRGKEYFAVGARDGEMVRMILRFPLDLIRRGLKVSVTAIDVTLNKDSQVRNTTLILQQLMQWYQQVFQGLMMAMSPQVPPPVQQMAMQMVQGSLILMRRLMDQQGLQDVDKILPDLSGGVNAQQQQLQELLALIRLGGGGGSPPGIGGQPGMGGPPAIPGGGYGGGAGQPPLAAGTAGALPQPR